VKKDATYQRVFGDPYYPLPRFPNSAADMFAALLRGDPTSYLNHGANDSVQFTPIAWFAPNGEFGLAELIKVALCPTP